jgi:aminomethyltransferase
MKKTALHSLHQKLDGKMVTFADYHLPVQYKAGLIAEHLHTRKSASLFDVSHMGQVSIYGDADKALSRQILTDFSALKVGQSKYSVITNEQGGIIDDCIVARENEKEIFIVFNASRKQVDIEYVQKNLPNSCSIKEHTELSLIAVQGPRAEEALAHFFPQIRTMSFMSVLWVKYQNHSFRVSRAGYTGEDGFEITILNELASSFCESLLALEQGALVKPAGLGARDSLRLEAGLALYGQDLTEQITPIEAGLLWTIPKKFRENGGFCGEKKILEQIVEKPQKKFVGFLPLGKIPIRQGASLCATDGQVLGEITSGGFSPSLQKPIAVGYLKKDFAVVGEKVIANVRGKEIICEIVKLPFVKHNYKK